MSDVATRFQCIFISDGKFGSHRGHVKKDPKTLSWSMIRLSPEPCLQVNVSFFCQPRLRINDSFKMNESFTNDTSLIFIDQPRRDTNCNYGFWQVCKSFCKQRFVRSRLTNVLTNRGDKAFADLLKSPYLVSYILHGNDVPFNPTQTTNLAEKGCQRLSTSPRQPLARSENNLFTSANLQEVIIC